MIVDRIDNAPKNASGLVAKAHIATQLPSRDHHTRLVSLAEDALRAQVLHATKRFAAELPRKGVD